jgi:hypothetical protein
MVLVAGEQFQFCPHLFSNSSHDSRKLESLRPGSKSFAETRLAQLFIKKSA